MSDGKRQKKTNGEFVVSTGAEPVPSGDGLKIVSDDAANRDLSVGGPVPPSGGFVVGVQTSVSSFPGPSPEVIRALNESDPDLRAELMNLVKIEQKSVLEGRERERALRERRLDLEQENARRDDRSRLLGQILVFVLVLAFLVVVALVPISYKTLLGIAAIVTAWGVFFNGGKTRKAEFRKNADAAFDDKKAA